jgi:UrcA family protein
MTISTLKFGFPLAIALAMASAAAVAEQADQTPNTKIEAGKVHETLDRSPYTGIPTERLEVDLPVSYADLDLTTPSGAAELKRRITAAAKEACERVDLADPVDLSDSDDTCVRTATDGAMKQANSAIAAARTNGANSATQANLN